MEYAGELPAAGGEREAEPVTIDEQRGATRASKHLVQLEPVRGVAILLVIVFHSTMFTMDASRRFTGDLNGIVYRALGCGWIGVDLFFVLSGFLITRILLRSKGRVHFLRNFYARRTLRIFPLYFAAISLWTLATHFHFGSSFGAGPWLWTYTSNILIGLRGWPALPVSVNHFWSLAVEEQFYLAWPFVVALLGRPALLRVCSGMLIVGVMARAGCVALGYPVAVYVWPLCRADSLLAGAAVALLLGDKDTPSAHLRAVASRVAWLSGFATVLIAMHGGGGLDSKDPWVGILGLTPILLFMASTLVLVLAVDGKASTGTLARALSSVGKYSYAMYVFQQPVLLALSRWQRSLLAPHWNELLREAFVVAAGSGLSLLLALISWHALEKHAIAMKRFFA